ncbi:hypothetical protein Ade02nite_23230 [Paractinoplanes deccanensis]|uniref:Uncharacterized protein n=2 Tax=Paractinoplanes deccanensis TaxID=113561 RepID=A0ABQ3Y125_9ACTN|nr:hypothetical protein Ade02nite_23230 [Actinoplanes deccanensis]
MALHRTARRLVGAALVLAAMLIGLAAAGAAWADPPPAPAPVTGTPFPTPNTPPLIPTPPQNGPSPTAPSSPEVPQPSPQPSPTPDSADDDDPGLFDIPGQIRKAINDFLIWVAKKILNPVLEALGSTALSTPDLTANPAVTAVWTTSMVTANALYGLLVLAGCFTIMSRESVQTQYGLKEIAPRVAAGAVLSNLSLIICGKAIEVANALTVGVMGQGVEAQAAADAIGEYLTSTLTGSSVNIMFGLLGIAVAALGIITVITFVMRVGLFIVLIGIGPIVLVLHATPQTEGIAYTWWRAIGACLGLQVGQAVIVLVTVKVFLTPKGMEVLGVPASSKGLLGVLACITMLWLLIKLPGLMKQFVLGPLQLQSQGRGLLGQLLQAFVTFKTLGAAAGLLSAGRNALPQRAAMSRPTSVVRAGTATRSVPKSRVTPSPGRSRPSPVAPVQFSHAPATQTPLAAPAAVNGPPAFSDSPQPATPISAPTGTAPAVPFSHLPTTGPAIAQPSRAAATPIFSNSTPSPSSPSPTRPLPEATFSSAPAKQTAPSRPPAPVTPVFSNVPASRSNKPNTSDPAAGQGATRKASTGRPTAARRANDPPTNPSPRRLPTRQAPATTASPPPTSSVKPLPRPAPRGTTTQAFRPAAPSSSPQARDTGTEPSPASSPPSSPPARRRPRGGKS